ncbi:MAG: GNAT family N-acetyltransferase [Actinobacteria bacterium]|nr:GNAT family N-acetyltransferase [Actinomycetota bacterium]
MEYRPITSDDFDGFLGVLGHVFAWDPKPEEVEVERKATEFDRTIAAFDNGAIVGTGGNITFEMTVPGGSARAGGVTAIGVLPSHRRRGVLTQMMGRLLDDSREHEESLSVLWASESSIYGRYGFGMANRHAAREIDRAHATFAVAEPSPGGVRLIQKGEALERLPGVLDQVVDRYPGMIRRSPLKWEVDLSDLEAWRAGATANRFALYEEDGIGLGYARYRIKEEWKEGHPQNTLLANEVIGVTDGATLAIWRFLFGIDLIKTIKARMRPLRDPLAYFLTDPRRLSFKVTEGIWVRILDVPAALEARRYPVEGAVTIEITGPDDVAGAYRIEGGPDGSSCRRTDEEPDLRMGVTQLGMRYLGDHDFVTLAAAGLVEGDKDALQRADLMFGWHEPTWCVVGF